MTVDTSTISIGVCEINVEEGCVDCSQGPITVGTCEDSDWTIPIDVDDGEESNSEGEDSRKKRR